MVNANVSLMCVITRTSDVPGLWERILHARVNPERALASPTAIAPQTVQHEHELLLRKQIGHEMKIFKAQGATKEDMQRRFNQLNSLKHQMLEHQPSPSATELLHLFQQRLASLHLDR